MRVKDDSVQIGGASSYLIFALVVANEVYIEHGYELVITSMKDGKHSVTSLHHRGDAADIRTQHIGTLAMKELIKDEIKRKLGLDFDVLLEGVDKSWEHIHIEFQPRQRPV